MTSGRDSLFDLEGKVVAITGGSRGLGREMAEAFAHRGARVAIASRKQDACEAAASEIAAASGSEVIGLGLHVGRWDQCEPFVEEVTDRLGPIDVLINNAGSSPLYPSLAEISERLFDSVIGLNLKGPFRLCALVGEQMLARDAEGSIINVSSIAAVQPSAVEVPYGMAKAGLNNLTVALAHMLGPRIRVNCIMPGPFLTDISKAWDLEDFAKTARQRIPLGRGGQPDEIVGTALYLASPASSYTTGAVIKVDGGLAWPPA
ncbi:MAG: SDR family oxidoreductase [Acidimicrobiaceae bacterium]|nr:SDR family oxidoreductase [Acidimicrobiaceae bacterium]MYH00548.1 SDR family oxidoreductase [Acidimicrobiaceae bacterium]MYL03849.1 SDR family oxidoreductase [Acidimicrobiaceae bacterium]